MTESALASAAEEVDDLVRKELAGKSPTLKSCVDTLKRGGAIEDSVADFVDEYVRELRVIVADFKLLDAAVKRALPAIQSCEKDIPKLEALLLARNKQKGKAGYNGAHPFVRSLAGAMHDFARQLDTLGKTYKSLWSRTFPKEMGDLMGDDKDAVKRFISVGGELGALVRVIERDAVAWDVGASRLLSR